MGLEQDQEVRRKEHPEVAVQIDEFIKQFKKLKNLDKPFTIVDLSYRCKYIF